MKPETILFISQATDIAAGREIDLCIADGTVIACGSAGTLTAPEGARTIDATGLYILPGLFDLHTHISITGKETGYCIAAAAAAARQGGVTGFQCMPNTSAVLDNGAQITSLMDIAAAQPGISIVPAGCISQNCEGEQQAPYDTLRCKGVKFITDADHIPHNLLMLYRAMKYACELGLTFALRGDLPQLTEKTYAHPSVTSYRLGLHGTPSCAEEIGIETIIRLAGDAGAAIHVQTVSTAGGTEIIRRAKNEGQRITAEAALHHLIYTHENIGDYDTNFKTLPPLRDRSDCEALIAAINDGTIDCIVSDHTPRIPFAKKQDFCSAPHGMIALDTYLPALYTSLVRPGHIGWQKLLQACAVRPRQLLGLDVPELREGSAADFILFDPEGTTEVTPAMLQARTENTPLLGTTLHGRVINITEA